MVLKGWYETSICGLNTQEVGDLVRSLEGGAMWTVGLIFSTLTLLIWELNFNCRLLEMGEGRGGRSLPPATTSPPLAKVSSPSWYGYNLLSPPHAVPGLPSITNVSSIPDQLLPMPQKHLHLSDFCWFYPTYLECPFTISYQSSRSS